MQTSIEELRRRFGAFGQDHIFRFWKRLDPAGRARLTAQAAQVDLAMLAAAHAETQALAAPGSRRLEPAPVERLPDHGGSAAVRAEGLERGEELLRWGRVAAMVVAGGQGTRLGFDGPKGSFPLGPVTQRPLFELQAQKIRGARRRHDAPIPWYVMTSQATDAPTRAFFARHDHFGLPPEDVFFLVQSMVPALDFEGRLMLEAPDRIAESPNGHGGTFSALVDSGALADMARRGISLIFYYQVDNPLIRLLDPVFLGLHDRAAAEMSCKVLRKLDPMEKMGVLARVDGHIGIVEYTEIDDAHRMARDAAGELVYWAASPAIHAIDVAFAAQVADRANEVLPFHASAKKIPTVDDRGAPVAPDAPNGHKLERFLFDALPAAREVFLLEVERDSEYAPVKNAEGPESPDTARRALDAQYRAWLGTAGVALPEGRLLELDHSLIDCAADVVQSGARSLSDIEVRLNTEVA